MSTGTENMPRGPRYRTQPPKFRWNATEAARRSAADVMQAVFPTGRLYAGLHKTKVSRARRDGGSLADVGLMMRAASPEGRRQMLGWLRAFALADDHADCVFEARDAYHAKDVGEEMVEPQVWQNMTVETARAHYAAVREEMAAAGRLCAAYERWLAAEEG